ncbi:hypothetical protein GCU67_20195 [Modestobacter muralis]|uniref:Uncharacterized protein n=1 Tax=Modestobacter muralis TaxID=1608614 RepID=A0A6P0EZW7_9ACTN|nr:hypothetical protein [Modestobacter muralis]
MQVAARQAQDAGLTFQANILNDGKVTDAEYRDAMDAHVSCIRQTGVKVTDPQLSLADNQRYLYEMTPGPGVGEGNIQQAEKDCYAQWRGLVDDQYFATNEPRMDAALLAGVQQCLRDRGVNVSGQETNVPDLQSDPANAPVDQLTTCIQSTGKTLYPGVAIPFMFDPLSTP